MKRFEYVLWGTPSGSTDAIDEKVLYTQGKSQQQIDRVKEVAGRDGWHSFRVQVLELEVAPDFGFIAR